MLSLELRLLAYSVALLFVLVAIQAWYGVKANGLMVMGAARDNLPAPTVMQARSKRLVDNMRENLWFFAPLVLIAAVMNLSNQWTELGARLFFYGRVVHAIWYLAGWPVGRFAPWLAGVVGSLLIFLAIMGVLT